jgi:hypothetical protein
LKAAEWFIIGAGHPASSFAGSDETILLMPAFFGVSWLVMSLMYVQAPQFTDAAHWTIKTLYTNHLPKVCKASPRLFKRLRPEREIIEVGMFGIPTKPLLPRLNDVKNCISHAWVGVSLRHFHQSGSFATGSAWSALIYRWHDEN